MDTFTAMFATLGCDSDVHDVQHVTDMLVVVLGFLVILFHIFLTLNNCALVKVALKISHL